MEGGGGGRANNQNLIQVRVKKYVQNKSIKLGPNEMKKKRETDNTKKQ